MRKYFYLLTGSIFLFIACNQPDKNNQQPKEEENIQLVTDSLIKKEIIIEKDFLYDKHTLEDTYPYKDTVRVFQWDKIKKYLSLVDSIQQVPSTWGILQNRGNKNGESPLVKVFRRDVYKLVVDTFGIERFQAIPLYLPEDTVQPERYGLDGSLVKIEHEMTNFTKISTIYFTGKWFTPGKYVKNIGDSIKFYKIIFVDRTNQNISTLEKSGSKWLVRSMNPATTGLHKPPLMHETPLGIFVIQEKKQKMVYLEDNSTAKGGFAPNASRFCNGGYVHGVPVNVPHTATIEFSPSLGTTPRSHMCVRNATSHSKFVYDWAPIEKSLVIVFD